MSFVIFISVLTPLLAYIWKVILDLIVKNNPQNNVLHLILLLSGYYLLRFIIEFLQRSNSVVGETAERLDVVQSNWLQCYLKKRYIRNWLTWQLNSWSSLE